MSRPQVYNTFTKDSVMKEVFASDLNLTSAILTISALQTVDEMEAQGTTHINARGWSQPDGNQMSQVTERIYASCATERDMRNSETRIVKYWFKLGRAGFGKI